jgi:hypothetical protein
MEARILTGGAVRTKYWVLAVATLSACASTRGGAGQSSGCDYRSEITFEHGPIADVGSRPESRRSGSDWTPRARRTLWVVASILSKSSDREVLHILC